jgi:hypothetical protein
MSTKWSLLLLLILVMGCEHTLGSAGFVEMALDKDMQAQGECDMPAEKWLKMCAEWDDKKSSEDCPQACRPPRRRQR